MGTIVPQMNEKKLIFKPGTRKERNKRSRHYMEKERKHLGTKIPRASINKQLLQKGTH